MIFTSHKRHIGLEQLLRNLPLLIDFICCVSVPIILGLVGLFLECCLINVFPSDVTAGADCRLFMVCIVMECFFSMWLLPQPLKLSYRQTIDGTQ